MFNRMVILPQHHTHSTQYVTREVHEHRAPTDQSVKLLREMEEKAKAEIVDAIHVGDTTFECVVHTMKFMADGSTKLMAVFSLNGKKLTAEYQDHDWKADPKTMAVGLRNAVAEKIATEILIPAFTRLDAWR